MADQFRKNSALATSAYDVRRHRIITSDLSHEPRLHTGSRCDQFDVGLSPVMAALSRLVSEGLVVRCDRQGVAVAPLLLAGLERRDRLSEDRVETPGQNRKSSFCSPSIECLGRPVVWWRVSSPARPTFATPGWSSAHASTKSRTGTRNPIRSRRGKTPSRTWGISRM